MNGDKNSGDRDNGDGWEWGQILVGVQVSSEQRAVPVTCVWTCARTCDMVGKLRAHW